MTTSIPRPVDDGDPGIADTATLATAVVICAYTDARWEALTAAVSALVEDDPSPDEIIVVIDHNEPMRARAEAALAGATVVANEGDRGLSGARNTGVSHATADVVLFLDDDACPTPGWLRAMVEGFAEPRVIGVGGVARPRWIAREPSWMPPEFLWVVGCSYRGLPDGRDVIRNPIGANMGFRRSAFGAVGGFTDGIGRVGRTPLGCEETEFSIRATARVGGDIVQLPDAVVDHLVPADRARIGYFVHRCWAEGLSKAIVAKIAGVASGLSSERSYLTATVPRGIRDGLRDLLHGDVWGLARTATIIVGVTVTAAGYVRGRVAWLARGVSDLPAGAGAASATEDQLGSQA